MSEPPRLTERATELGRGIAFPMTDRDVQRIVGGTRRLLRRRRARRAMAASLGGVVLAGAGLWWALSSLGSGSSKQAASHGGAGQAATVAHRGAVATEAAVATGAAGAATVPAPTRLADGSLVTPLDRETHVHVVSEEPRRVVVALDRGRTRVEVVPNHDRAFEVRAGDVTVQVLGTIFTVERVADRVGVSVERGTVRVSWGVGHQDLQVGSSGWFPPLQVRAEAAQADRAAALLRAADAARAAGWPADAVELLDQVVRDWPRDPQAPLAAFTLGRVLMLELHRPAQAATAFATARGLAPDGPFAEDALAREVEAWAAANDRGSARRRAREYVRAYPQGRRLHEVRAFGELP